MRLGRKGLPGTNTLAYFASSSLTQTKKSFATLGPVAYTINITIVNDASRVIKMAMVSDGTTWRVTYDCN